MFLVDLRGLARAPAETRGTLAADDPLLTNIGFVLAAPVKVTGRISMSGPGQYYWSAELTTRVVGSCRRCLADIDIPVRATIGLLFSEDQAADDPSVWVIPLHAAELDLRDAIREELILAVPEYAVCREDCRGICPQCGKDLNLGSCTCQPPADARWAALEVLKEQLPNDSR